MIVEDAHLPHSVDIATVTYLTVGLSVLVHGLSASPLVNRYVSWFKTTSDKGPPVMETKPAHEYRPRLLGHSENLRRSRTRLIADFDALDKSIRGAPPGGGTPGVSTRHRR